MANTLDVLGPTGQLRPLSDGRVGELGTAGSIPQLVTDSKLNRAQNAAVPGVLLWGLRVTNPQRRFYSEAGPDLPPPPRGD